MTNTELMRLTMILTRTNATKLENIFDTSDIDEIIDYGADHIEKVINCTYGKKCTPRKFGEIVKFDTYEEEDKNIHTGIIVNTDNSHRQEYVVADIQSATTRVIYESEILNDQSGRRELDQISNRQHLDGEDAIDIYKIEELELSALEKAKELFK